jgi:hypothetical protein
VQAQGLRQVFQKRPDYKRKIAAVEINDRWAVDIIDYNAQPSADPQGGDPYEYILIVQDIFSRPFLYTRSSQRFLKSVSKPLSLL